MRFSQMKLGHIFTAIAATLLIGSASVQAGSIKNFLDYNGGLNTIDDLDYERLVEGTGYSSFAAAQESFVSGVAAPDGGSFLGLGSKLEAVVKFEALINSVTGGGTDLDDLIGPDYQLTAYSVIEAIAATDFNAGFGTADILFGNGLQDPFGDDVVAVIYEEDGGTEVDFGTQSFEEAVAAATDGIFLLSAGVVAADDFWGAVNSSLDTNPNAPGNSAQAVFFAGLSRVNGSIQTEENGTFIFPRQEFGFPVGNSFHDITVQGDVTPTEFGPTELLSDLDFAFRAVPEPGSFAIWSIIGLGVAAKRRRRIKA
jgi:hypothetical protein